PARGAGQPPGGGGMPGGQAGSGPSSQPPVFPPTPGAGANGPATRGPLTPSAPGTPLPRVSGSVPTSGPRMSADGAATGATAPPRPSAPATPPSPATTAPAAPAITPAPAGLPQAFIENRGQWDGGIKFAATNGAIGAQLTGQAIRLSLAGQQATSVSLTFEGA